MRGPTPSVRVSPLNSPQRTLAQEIPLRGGEQPLLRASKIQNVKVWVS